MASFSSFLDTLPVPVTGNKIGDAGQVDNSGGGIGFASVKFSSEQPVSISRSNSGRVISRAIVSHKYRISVTYNPMTREQFEPVYSFLLEKRGRLKPFFIILPQYENSRGITSTNTITVSGAHAAGKSQVKTVASASSPVLKPGHLITFSDAGNSNHKKAYQITRTMTSSDYYTGGDTPASNQQIYYISPPLEKAITASTTTINYNNPKVRVISTSDVIEYSLGTNNLYSFTLNLEEAQP